MFHNINGGKRQMFCCVRLWFYVVLDVCIIAGVDWSRPSHDLGLGEPYLAPVHVNRTTLSEPRHCESTSPLLRRARWPRIWWRKITYRTLYCTEHRPLTFCGLSLLTNSTFDFTGSCIKRLVLPVFEAGCRMYHVHSGLPYSPAHIGARCRDDEICVRWQVGPPYPSRFTTHVCSH